MGMPPKRLEQTPPEELSDIVTSAKVGWTAAQWLSGSHVQRAVADALCDETTSSNHQLKCIRELGCSGDASLAREALRSALLSGQVVDKIVECVLPSLIELTSDVVSSAEELHGKFMAEGSAFTLSYGGLEEFFGGLEKKIGAPQASATCAAWTGLDGVLASEHLERADSETLFSASNYGTDTTSATEHAFCAAPDTRKQSQWPKEGKLTGSMASRRRQPLPLAQLATRVDGKNKRLAAAKEPLLIHAEAVGARLYTGPMFVKYNAVLRGYGSAIDFLRGQFESLCQHNTYTTTLHIINSSIVKLSKLTKVEKVYRGISGGVLPPAFWTPNDFNVCGGIESAFMSATTDPSVAQSYAGGRGAGKAGCVFEIQQGMVDRGADMAWISQYPHEAEITFAPLTGLEVQQTSVKGALLKICVRLSVNLAAPTIEQVLAKRKKVVTDMCHHMSESLEREVRGPTWEQLQRLLSVGTDADVDAIGLARAQLQTSIERATEQDAQHFNEDAPLGKAIEIAVEARRSVDFPAGLTILQACKFGTLGHTAEVQPHEIAPSSATAAQRVGSISTGRRRNSTSATNKDWAGTVHWLRTCGVQKLDFGRGDIGNAGVGALALLLTHVSGSLTRVEKLILEKTGVGRVGLGRLCQALEAGALPTLREISLSGNFVGNSGIATLASALTKGAMPHLRDLKLANVGCKDSGLMSIADALASTAHPLRELRELDLSDNSIGDRGITGLAVAMSGGELPILQTLKLGSNEIGDPGIAELAKALLARKGLALGGEGKNMVDLQLDNNWIGDAGMSSLATTIVQGCLPALRNLELDDNLIADDGMAVFADALLANPSGSLPSLASLDLDGSDISAAGFDKLAMALKADALPALETLEIDDDELEHEALNQICKQRKVKLV